MLTTATNISTPTRKYPHDCVRCGICCLIQACPAERTVYGPREAGGQCPALAFKGVQSCCALMLAMTSEDAQRIMGAGAGCCIKGQVMIGNGLHDLASLPTDIKQTLASRIRSHQIPVVQRQRI